MVTKRTTTRSIKSGARRSETASSSERTSTKRNFADRTGKAIKDRPVASAAIATGLVSGVAAAIAGFLAFKRSGKTFSEFSDDVATSVKDGASSAKARIKDGIADARARAKDWSEPTKDGVEDVRTQSEIAEEALTAKAIGKKTDRPIDPTIEEELKVGSISY